MCTCSLCEALTVHTPFLREEEERRRERETESESQRVLDLDNSLVVQYVCIIIMGWGLVVVCDC